MPKPDADSALPPPPHCPHCDAELPLLGMYMWQQSNMLIVAMHCTDCMKVLNISAVPMGPVPMEPSRIQVPH